MDDIKYIYAGAAEESHNGSVRMMVKNKIVDYAGFDDRLIKHRDDRGTVFHTIVNESVLVSGCILIGFAKQHAMIFVVISDDEQWLESAKEFDYLKESDNYKDKYLSELYRTHIRYQNTISEDFILEWEKVSPKKTLSLCDRVFYVCKFADAHILEIQSVALSALPAFYSKLHTDCLEFCKTFVKNFIGTFGLDCIEPELIDTLTITDSMISSKVEGTSRRNTSAALSGNRAVNALESGTKANISGFITGFLGVTLAHIIWKLA